ncbi:uncharacterized protein K452DRAFT_4221 [Aplosporella prunicola CBS 121167]|uniref:Uncharacterized protein n=1 Tax=Aplosporella prunicola CBS 121167 TaxID=1176127 RepID=A0A6A6BVF2_9PEZI|nr:uncharacterized protein K452DRAFT_4221 [Aplosporella prunicola CBS 121167]KAF2147255.1 hypothetical protein K452DRAFT_4221 [Aplosporella prunicola CBS 121167]
MDNAGSEFLGTCAVPAAAYGGVGSTSGDLSPRATSPDSPRSGASSPRHSVDTFYRLDRVKVRLRRTGSGGTQDTKPKGEFPPPYCAVGERCAQEVESGAQEQERIKIELAAAAAVASAIPSLSASPQLETPSPAGTTIHYPSSPGSPAVATTAAALATLRFREALLAQDQANLRADRALLASERADLLRLRGELRELLRLLREEQEQKRASSPWGSERATSTGSGSRIWSDTSSTACSESEDSRPSTASSTASVASSRAASRASARKTARSAASTRSSSPALTAQEAYARYTTAWARLLARSSSPYSPTAAIPFPTLTRCASDLLDHSQYPSSWSADVVARANACDFILAGNGIDVKAGATALPTHRLRALVSALRGELGRWHPDRLVRLGVWDIAAPLEQECAKAVFVGLSELRDEVVGIVRERERAEKEEEERRIERERREREREERARIDEEEEQRGRPRWRRWEWEVCSEVML